MISILFNDFKNQLERYCIDRDIFISNWNKRKTASKNIIMIKKNHVSILLYVKVRNERPGFWGLTLNQIDNLSSSGIIWHAIFLLETINTGYIFTDKEVEKHINNKDWTLSIDGDYKVNEGKELYLKNKFNSFEDLMNKIFGNYILKTNK